MDQILTHRIRERAYEIWAANGYRDGDAEQHWLAAEREILEVSVTATAAAAHAGRLSQPRSRRVSANAASAERFRALPKKAITKTSPSAVRHEAST